MKKHEAAEIVKMYQFGVPSEVQPHSFDLNDETVAVILEALGEPEQRWPVLDECGPCMTCRHCRYEPEKITADPIDSHPAEVWCEEEMESFGTLEGCYMYEQVEEDI